MRTDDDISGGREAPPPVASVERGGGNCGEVLATKYEAVPANPVGEGYRPHLDGLRAVAVYLVVLYHAGIVRFSGGFIGVDVFFVLSGYLVTQLLVRDLSTQGNIRIARFYARRFRRLFPASFVALVVTAVVYSAIAPRAEVASAVNAFKAAFLYSANWFFIRRSTDYFATDINTNPVIHFWSLAVEEQFYFVWPILLTGIVAATGRLRTNARRATQLVVGVAALLSLAWALRLAGESLNRAYYGTDARAYELLGGAFLALSPGLIRRTSRWRAAAVAAAAFALAGLVALSTSLFDLSAVHRGVAATAATFVLIVAIESARGGPVNRVLSSGPAVYLGQISYGTYLWHWPVIVVALSLTNGRISPLSLFAMSALVATGLASLSFHLVERPVRQGQLLDRMNPAVIGAGLGLALVAALLIVPRVLEPARAQAGATQLTTTSGFTPVPKIDFARAAHAIGSDLHDVPFLRRWNCEGKPASACVIVKGGPESILVIGDSHAQMFFPTFAKIAKTEGLTLETAASAGCPWQRNLYLPSDGLGGDDLYTKECITFKRDLYTRVIPELKPTLIVAISNDYLFRRPGVERDASGKTVAATSAAELRQQVETDTQQSLQSLKASAGKVLILEPVPTTLPKDDPFLCLTKSKFLEDCRFVTGAEPTTLQLIYRGDADNKRVFTADFAKLLCPYDPICDPIVNGLLVRFDNQHITPLFAEALAPEVTRFLQDAGLIAGG